MTVKESIGDKIIITAIPTSASQLRRFHESVKDGVASCAIHGEVAWRWVRLVEALGSVIEDFAESHYGRCSTPVFELTRLGYKLKQALANQLKGEVAKLVHQKDQHYQNTYNLPLKGRQVLWLVYKLFAVSGT